MLSVLLAQELVLLGPDSLGSLASLVSSILLSVAIFKLCRIAQMLMHIIFTKFKHARKGWGSVQGAKRAGEKMSCCSELVIIAYQ